MEAIEKEMEEHGGVVPVGKLDEMSEAHVKDLVAAAEAQAKQEAAEVEEERRSVAMMKEGPEKEAAKVGATRVATPGVPGNHSCWL